MHVWKDYSIRTKLILLATICSGLALLLSCFGFVISNLRAAQTTKVEELRTQARMLAFNSTAVLTFRDQAAAERLLRSLKSQPSVELGCLYNDEGQILATYTKSPNSPFSPPARPGTGHRFIENQYIDLFQDVTDQGEQVGTLYLRTNLQDLHAKFIDYLKIVAVVAFGALLASIALSTMLQQGISGPIVRLADTARKISSTDDYSIRVASDSSDEIGRLYGAFNRMLKQVETSRQALKNAVANMSHEIRTPINAILGFTDLIRDGAHQGDPEKQAEFLETISTSGRYLLKLINDILDLSRLESGEIEIEKTRCSPHRTLVEVVSMMRVRAQEKGLSLEYEWNTRIPQTIYTDESRLRQLLTNLIGNAIKFTDEGEIRLAVRLLEEDPPKLAIDVADSGMGIPPEKLQSIFNPFSQADNSITRQYGGTGLGLAISRQIARLLGGDVTVSSTVGSGSTFTVVIETGPLADVPLLDHVAADVAVSQETIPSSASPATLPPIHVLVVEDGVANRKLIRLILERAGATVTVAENGRIGVDLATRQHFDLILMDVQMPVMDGHTATGLLREQGVNIPIIALTAHAMKGDEARCLAAGCTGYLTKPVDSDRLIRKVAEAVRAEELKLEGEECSDDGRGQDSGVANCKSAIENLQLKICNSQPLHSSLPTDDPAFREIVEEFTDRLHQQLAAMQDARRAGDFEELADLAHWLKGSGGTAGFDDMTEPARRLERAARHRAETFQVLRAEQDEQQIDALLAELNSLADRISIPAAH